jgi:hypothetical protein
MSAKTPINDPLEQMRAADPASAEALRAELGRDAIDAAMHRSIALAKTQPTSLHATERRSRRPLALGLGLACAATIAALILLIGGSSGDGGQLAFAAAAVRVAEENPRLLVSEPGWSVTRANAFDPDEGEVTFSDGTFQLTANWYPARFYKDYLEDRATVSPPVRSRLLGLSAATVYYGYKADFATMLAPEGEVFLELRGNLGTEVNYKRVIDSLRRASVEQWLSAMPANVVRPEGRAQAVDELLRGVPYPPDLDIGALRSEGAVLERSQLAAKVAGAIGCGWTERWIVATKSGDSQGAQEAVDAMAGWSQWPLTREFIGEVPAIGNLRIAAKELVLGQLNRGVAGVEVSPDGTAIERGPAWAMRLGCESHYWQREDRHQPRG